MNKKEQVCLIGGGGHCKVILSVLKELNYKIQGIYDSDSRKWGKTILGIKINPLEEIYKKQGYPSIIAIGDNKIRKSLSQKLDMEWITVIHPKSYVHTSVKIGKGTVIFAGAVIQPDSIIGDHVIINTSASVDHDCIIKNYVHLAPGTHLAGNVTIEEGAFLGIGSSVIPGKCVSQWSIVGAGGVVIQNIPPKVVAVGVPAKIKKYI